MDKKYTYAELTAVTDIKKMPNNTFFIALSERPKPNPDDYKSSVIDTNAHLTGDFMTAMGEWVKTADLYPTEPAERYQLEALALKCWRKKNQTPNERPELLVQSLEKFVETLEKSGVEIPIENIVIQWDCQERKLNCQDCECPRVAVLIAPFAPQIEAKKTIPELEADLDALRSRLNLGYDQETAEDIFFKVFSNKLLSVLKNAITEAAAFETQLTPTEKSTLTLFESRKVVVDRIFEKYKTLILQ